MSCRKAFDIDLADFLAHAGTPEWREFREHYPRCPGCAAEVRAWTELHHLLQRNGTDTHPPEERLLRFETERAALSAAERETIAQHLAACRSCADELAALRRFDFRGLAPAPAVPRRAPRVSDLAALVRQVVLHPAFAYGLVVLLLLYPAAVGRFAQERRDAGRIAGALQREPDAPRRKLAPAPEEALHALGYRDAPSAEHAPRAEQTLRERPREAAKPATATERWTTLLLRHAERAEVSASRLGAGLVLQVPAPTGPPGDVHVRVVDAEGRRELRESFPAGTGGKTLAVDLPAGWLLPGAYRVEVERAGNTPGGAEFSFEVR